MLAFAAVAPTAHNTLKIEMAPPSVVAILITNGWRLGLPAQHVAGLPPSNGDWMELKDSGNPLRAETSRTAVTPPTAQGCTATVCCCLFIAYFFFDDV